MSPRIWKLTTLGLLALTLLSCDVGQAKKTLGKKVVGGTGNGASDADAFSVTLAYRDSAADSSSPSRLVSIQGIRAVPSASLVNECGSTGNGCTCEFYRGSNDPTPVTATLVGLSSQNNSFSCTIPTGTGSSGISDTEITTPASGKALLVKLKSVSDNQKNTALVAIKSKLTITDILGSNLVKNKVRGVFRYNCQRTFFEGEGVSPGTISCAGGQHLGVIGAEYHFYTFKSQEDSNLPGTDTAFPADICKRNTFLKNQCAGNTPDLRYGLYKEAAEPFTVGVQLIRAPEGDNLVAVYGFAAVPDSSGNCPTGLVKIRQFVAQPGSIIPSGPSCPAQGCPSSFINSNNGLNDPVVEQAAPANFLVTRQPNQTPCKADGDCTTATFAGQLVVQSVAYAPMTPVLCAIPPDLLSGLF